LTYFTNGHPRSAACSGRRPDAFGTNGGGAGTTWDRGHGKRSCRSSGAGFNGINNSVEATLLTNTSPEGTGTGDSNQGLKENATFTVSGMFQLVAPATGTGYSIDLTNATSGQRHEEVQIQVVSAPSGGAEVVLTQDDPVTGHVHDACELYADDVATGRHTPRSSLL